MKVIKNPFFFIPVILFWTNQFFERVMGWHSSGFLSSYADDLLAMPVILGITLQIYQWIHPKKELFTFSKAQVLVAFVYVSIVFEFLLPKYSSTYTSDYWDILCYGLGSIYFYKFINHTRRSLIRSKV